MSINAERSREIAGGNSRNSTDLESYQKANTINSISNNANLKDFNQSFKIREFEWFEVETKIRKFVNELLQPTIKKISIDKKMLDDINDKIDKNNDSVKCLHDIIHYNNDGVKVIDNIYQKIATTNSNLEILNNKHNQQQERILQFEQNLLKDFQHIKDEMREVHKSRDKFQEDKNSLIEYFESFKKNTQDIISSLNKEITTSSQWTKQEFSKSWEHILKIDHQTNQNTQEIQIHNSKINEIFEKLTQINLKNSNFEQSMEQANKAISIMQNNINTAKKLTNKIEELMNKFKMVENYIEKYSSLYVQGQISDTLFSVLDKSSKRKLIQYEDKAFAAMNQVILNDDGIPNLNQKIEESINYLEKIVKRNAKYLQQKNGNTDDPYPFPSNQNEISIPFGFVDTFRQNSNGIDSVDEDNFNYEQKSLSPFSNNTIQPQNVNIEVRVQRNNSSSSNRNASSSNNNNIASQNQVITPVNNTNNSNNNNNNTTIQAQNKVNTQHSKRSSLNSLNSQQKYDISNRQFAQLKLMIDLEVQRMKEAIENKTTNLQNGLLENEEIMQINISKIQEEMEKGINVLKQQNNNVLLETGVLDKKITGIWNELEKIVNTFNILSETVHKLIHFNTLSNSLVLQDELDKQSIALYGFRSNFSDDPKMVKTLRNPAIMASSPGTTSNVAQKTISKGAFPNLILDQNCISCSGQSAQINQAFKMACLAYNPSTVNIDGRSYKREEVLEVATRLLQAARQQYGLKQNVNDFQELSQIESSSQNDVLDVSLNRTDQANQNNEQVNEESNKQAPTNFSNKIINNSAINTQNSALDNVRTAITQNSTSSFSHNGRFYINSQLSNNDQQQFRTNYANTSQNNASFLNQQSKIQNILPQLEGLKPRSRAISKNKSIQNNQQRIGSSQRREHTHH
ncbi:hypothetical protein TTHERM_00298520 (macronuclear) [Tetrahymena thermophila SB210]|uniref:Uncharacterized protein n=1 Tax=Tetrahymena thermophila (strain SB210) TaxID=312017 RepID=I7MAB0_TETTS|nr:hypothetical protein TTHERM_00298520 [Tetrahymena thermophila SB210]EAS04241.2 hypothetical protein TTHERM_00298520 [Tetrahymena thermophila SB210]|eukprot:XP_001024486.2 hypothetical protein TTHERM_00298520 [Tetrahymena thermophila SB210]